LEVQQQILEAVHIEVSSVEKAALRLEREIELLREYRTRLVADVVTGKLDVREAAAGLPDEVTRGTVEDAADLGEDLDTADEEATA
jgi:type I restriction enzyme S subunit